MRKSEKVIANKVNNDLNTVRAVENVIKLARPSKIKLGEITIPNQATDMEVMFLGKMMLHNIEQGTRMGNMHRGLMESYGNVPEEAKERMTFYKDSFEKDFEEQKKVATKIIATHPLSKKLCQIKGFTEYQLGIVMACMKDVKRFPSPSNLFVYAGVAPKNGIVVTKGTMALHRMAKHEFYGEGNEPEDFKEFGFNTTFKQRMYIIGESILKQKGFFYNEFLKARKHLEERAINNGECFVATELDQKTSKGIMRAGERYMVGKKNQSLIMWSYKNAFWRQCRTLLHFIYCEWCELEGIQARELYCIEYLGHQRKMTIDECLAYEKGLKEKD